VGNFCRGKGILLGIKLQIRDRGSLTLKKALVLAGVVFVMLVAVSLVAQAPTGQATASAQQHPINNASIQAEILFLDTGSDVNGLVLSGRAVGLDPTQTYFSLLYNTGSVPGGASACTPSSGGPAITDAQMFTAFWTVAPDGTGTLFRQKTGAAYVPLSEVATVSIRNATPGMNPPFFNTLQACAEINVNPN
jgi:hypothetical protein